MKASRRPALILSLMSVAHAVIHAQTALMPLVYAVVSTEFVLSTVQIGFIIAVTDLVGGLSQVAYGFVTRYARRARVLAVGYVVLGLSMFAAGLAKSAAVLLVALIGARLGASPQHPLGSAMISDHFADHRRGIAISTHVAGANLGAVLIPFLGTGLIAAAGWNLTLALIGIPALVMAILVWVLIRDEEAPPTTAPHTSPRRPTALASRDLVTVILAGTVAAGGRGLLVAPFVLLYLSGPVGLDQTLVAALYTALLVGAIIGPVLAGHLSDRFGRLPVLVGYYLVSGLGIMAFIAAGKDLVLLSLLFVPFGMAVFSESPILQALLADRTPVDQRNSIFSIFFTVTFGVGALWALIIGVIIESNGFQAGFATMAATYFAAAAIVLTLPRRTALASAR